MASVPASRIEVFDVLIPANTPSTAPQTTPTRFQQGELVGLELVFPDGCAGLVGIRVNVGGGQAIPATRGAWMIGNDETIRYDLAGQLDNGAWSITGYNSDAFDHTVHVRFLVADFPLVGGAGGSTPPTLPLLS